MSGPIERTYRAYRTQRLANKGHRRLLEIIESVYGRARAGGEWVRDHRAYELADRLAENEAIDLVHLGELAETREDKRTVGEWRAVAPEEPRPTASEIEDRKVRERAFELYREMLERDSRMRATYEEARDRRARQKDELAKRRALRQSYPAPGDCPRDEPARDDADGHEAHRDRGLIRGKPGQPQTKADRQRRK